MAMEIEANKWHGQWHGKIEPSKRLHLRAFRCDWLAPLLVCSGWFIDIRASEPWFVLTSTFTSEPPTSKAPVVWPFWRTVGLSAGETLESGAAPGTASGLFSCFSRTKGRNAPLCRFFELRWSREVVRGVLACSLPPKSTCLLVPFEDEAFWDKDQQNRKTISFRKL